MENYDPVKVESEIKSFWEKNKIYEYVKNKNKGKKKFYFLDGPPYPTGDPHPGTLANKILKDFVLRVKRMFGYDVWDRPGWDTHGLPVENKAEKKLGLKDKKDIENFGVKKFVEYCKNFASENMESMTNYFKLFGVWMDWKNAYKTMDLGFMDKEWYGIKRAWENGLLYEGEKTVNWCPHCATTLAKNELDYKKRDDPSIYVKFKCENGDYLLIWTTTPWTLPFNVAVMVNPDAKYVKVKVKNENWIVAKDLLEEVMDKLNEENYKIIEEFKGEKLKGVKYKPVFYEEMPWHQKKKHAYFVVLSKEFVDATRGTLSSTGKVGRSKHVFSESILEMNKKKHSSSAIGTGLVHCAPGCGPEDYIVGVKNKLPIFNDLNEHGEFGENSGIFKGWKAKEDDKKFIDLLKEKGVLLKEETINHDYAHCWRCGSPVVFRATKQWFIAISKIKNKILKEIKKLYTIPDYAKQTYLEWVKNFDDWCISLQRFWNTPLPIWRCDKCGNIEVIGGVTELEKKSNKKVKDLHRHYVDNITWKCNKCNGTMKRIPDVLTVWMDAGSATWATIPEDKFEELMPIDFISEGRDQIRGWFSALMNIYMAAFGKGSPYKMFYWHGFFNDEKGQKMSKSLGNFISPEEFAKEGIDAARISSVQWIKPGIDPNISLKEVKENKKYLNIFWNIGRYILNYANYLNYKPKLKLNESKLTISDKWILSKVNTLIKETLEKLEKYYLSEIPKPIRVFFVEDLSREYIQQVRKRINEGDKVVLDVLFYVYDKLLKLMAPVTPFITEKIYQEFKKLGYKEKTIHAESFPKVDEKWINKRLEKQMDIAKNIIRKILAAREKAKINLRWPLLKAIIPKVSKEMKELIKEQTNIKEICTNKNEIKGYIKYKIDYKKLKEKFNDEEIPQIIARIYELGDETLFKKLQNNEVIVKVNNKNIKLNKNFFMEGEEILPKNIIKYNDIYLFIDTTKELLAEGYTREIQRKIQDLRKEHKLNKLNKINIIIDCDNELKDMINANQEWLTKNTGINKLEFKPLGDTKEFKIKDKAVKIKITKILK